MKKTIIISGGEKGGLDFALSYKADEYADTYIIACDKGYKYALEEGIRPDYIIGDFDSYKGELPADIPTDRLPVEKNDTDTMHAVRTAISIKSDLLIICCALGGRLDHLMSNIQAARYCAEHGCKTIVCGSDTIFHILHNESLILSKNEQYTLSVLSLSDESLVSIKGTKYECENERITADFPIGQSNEWKESAAEIRVSAGTATVITSVLNEQ